MEIELHRKQKDADTTSSRSSVEKGRVVKRMPGRNDKCQCGSGLKFKACCLPIVDAASNCRRGCDRLAAIRWVEGEEGLSHVSFGDHRAWKMPAALVGIQGGRAMYPFVSPTDDWKGARFLGADGLPRFVDAMHLRARVDLRAAAVVKAILAKAEKLKRRGPAPDSSAPEYATPPEKSVQ